MIKQLNRAWVVTNGVCGPAAHRLPLKQLVQILLLVCATSLISSCVSVLSTDTRVTLRADENWQAQLELVFQAQQAQLEAGQIETSFNQFVASLKAAGIEANWTHESQRGDGNVGYRLAATGQGLEKLNTAFFNNQNAFTVNASSGQRRISFHYDPSLSQLGLVGPQSFTLTGGQILSSNGMAVDAHTVTWINTSGPMVAELTEAPRFNWLPVVLIGGGLILLLFAAIAWSRSRRQRVANRVIVPAPMPTLATLPVQAQFCRACGRPLSADASFCPNCGTKR